MESMNKLLVALVSFFTTREDEDRGATMVEYGIMVAFIAVAVMGVVLTLGGQIAGFFTDITTALGG